MKDYEKTVILLLFFVVLNFHLRWDFAEQNIDRDVVKAHFSTGTSVSINQASDNMSKYDVVLWIKDWEEETALSGLNVTLYGSDKGFVDSEISNDTGHAYFRLEPGSYLVSVQSGNRSVGYQEVTVTKPEILTIRTWAYDLTVKGVDLENKPLADHIVFLYDQTVFYTPTNFTIIANQTGLLVKWTKTDVNGTARFKALWNGTYTVKIAGGEVIGEEIIDLQESENKTIQCNRASLKLIVTAWSGIPLFNATVYIHNGTGNLIFRDRTDQNGIVFHESIYAGNYTVFVEWLGTQVWSGVLEIGLNREVPIRTNVYKLTLRLFGPFGNALPDADITLRKRVNTARGWTYAGPTITLKTGETGSVSYLLPSGTYEISCSYGIYSNWPSQIIINLASDYTQTINCNVQPTIWLSTFLVASPLVVLTLLLERRRLRTPIKIRKYKNMLMKLESMYTSGLVEYKTYRKLREEYEAKLMELGGRERR